MDMLQCPTKQGEGVTCSGRFLYDLAKQTITNIKKAGVITDKWLDGNGELPLGTSWADLYAHLLDCRTQIHSKEEVFTGSMNIIYHSKHNENRENVLNILAINDEDDCAFGKGGREKRRNLTKVKKHINRDLDTGNSSPFAARGLTLDSRIQIIELAQFQDSTVIEHHKSKLHLLTTRYYLLLQERTQEMELSKFIRPQYDATHPSWITVGNFGKKFLDLKNMITKVENLQMKSDQINLSSELAVGFLSSVCATHLIKE